MSMGEAAKPSLMKVSLKVSGFAVSMGEAIRPFLFDVVKVSKLEEVSHEMLVFRAPTCVLSSLWLSCSFAVSMGEATKSFLFDVVKM